MTWMLTANGHVVDVKFMRLSDTISLSDIALSLAKLCRFAGHTNRLYSVAEHSMLVCEIMARDYGITDPAALLAGLMHDAHEAYTGDLTAPMKQAVGAAWHAAEASVHVEVLRRFNLLTASQTTALAIHAADMRALATERRDLMPPNDMPWPCLDGYTPVDWVDLNAPERTALTWQQWADRFVSSFQLLDRERELRAQALAGAAHG